MKRLLSILSLLLISVFFVSCSDSKTYHPSQVQIVSEGCTDSGVELRFRPLAESMFSCPGVLYQQKGDQIHFEYVRRNINRKDTDVQLAVTRLDNGDLSVVFPLADGQKRIELIDSAGKSLGAWQVSRKDNNRE